MDAALDEVILPKVLIVDDRTENLLAFEVAIRPLACEVVTLTSGAEALRFLETYKAAVIILDVQMPNMDGFEVAQRIRANEASSITPIIFVTANGPNDRVAERAYQSGATAFLSKPVDSAVLRGKVAYFIKLYDKIERTNETQAKQLSAIENEKLLLLENSLDAIIGADAEQKIIYWNRHAEVTFGWNYQEAAGRKMSELIIPQRLRAAHELGMNRFLKTGESTIQNRRIEVPALRKNGDEFPVELTVTSIRSSDGQYRFYSFLRDISERVLAKKAIEESAEEMRRAKNEAEKANKLKSSFLANMSHEIRTPLGAMLGFTDLLRDPALPSAERDSYLDIISKNGESLAVIINDILDLSKVEAGHLVLNLTDTEPAQIVADVVSLLAVKAKEKGLDLQFEIHSSTPKKIVSDPVRARQVLLNLVGNAVKFTQTGSVKIVVRGQPQADDHAVVSFCVLDSGVGVPKAEVNQIFEMFVQAEDAITRRFGGTGLGLSLSRKLARSLGGDVVLKETNPGEGSIFEFTVVDLKTGARKSDRRDVKIANPIKLRNDSLSALKVLVIDDAADNQLLIQRYLEKYGALVDQAENGLVGYRKALLGNFDIVLMDIQMPQMDGYTATQKLRANGYRKPIIALTAHAMTEVQEKCLDVGCSAHLPKPIVAQHLIETIIRLTAKPRTTVNALR